MKRAPRGATSAQLRARAFKYLLRARQNAEKAEALYRAAQRREEKETEAEFRAAGAAPRDETYLCECGADLAGEVPAHTPDCPDYKGGVVP